MKPPKPECSNLERILSSIPDGKLIALSYARTLSFKDDRYHELIATYDGNRSIDLGTLCEQCKIPPQDFLADINRAMYPLIDEAMNFAKGLATDIIAQRLPKVVQRGMIEGAKADGIADRHFTLQKEGFHTAPKGMMINVNQQNNTAAGIQSFEDQTKELNDILNADEDHLLESGDAFVEAELTEDLREEAVV